MPPAPSLTPAVVLVRPQEEGNVGAVARVMANLGLDRLVLVEPAVALGEVARARAVGATTILDRAVRAPSLDAALAPFQVVVATSSSRGRQSGGEILAPRALAARLAVFPPSTRIALLFGPESSGLTNDELARAGLLVTIPAEARQPTLNLSHAVCVLAYEIHVARAPRPDATDAPEPAGAAEVEGLLRHLDRLLRLAGFARDDTYDGVLRDLRRMAARGAPSVREVRILRGICRRLEHRLAGRDLPEEDGPTGAGDAPARPAP